MNLGPGAKESGRAALIPGLPDEAAAAIVSILGSCPEVRRVRLFGSRAKGNYRHGSDIDLCLDAPGLSFQQRPALEDRLDDLLLPWKIDLVLAHDIDLAALRDHIERVGMTLFQNPPEPPARERVRGSDD